MTIDELKAELAGMTLPETHKLSSWENIGNVNNFIATQLQMIEQAGENYPKSVAFHRLTRFYQSIKS